MNSILRKECTCQLCMPDGVNVGDQTDALAVLELLEVERKIRMPVSGLANDAWFPHMPGYSRLATLDFAGQRR